MPVLYTGKIDRLDRTNLCGRFINTYNNKKCSIYFHDDADFLKVHPFLAQEEVSIIASPILEYGAFDLNSGDLFFIALATNNDRAA